jgi:DNA-directed RNA polymerase specialized sigma24 family protein
LSASLGLLVAAVSFTGDAASDALKTQSPRKNQLRHGSRKRSWVEMKVFEDLTGDEMAERLGCSRRTVANYWNVARQWLRKEWAGR